MPQHGHQDHEGQDDISALTFFNSSGSDDDSGLGALRAQSSGHAQDATTDVDAIRLATDDGAVDDAQMAEGAEWLMKVTNLPGTVAVTALPDGSVMHIDLSPKVASMSESALAEEILVIADLARQKGQAKQQSFLVDVMEEMGLDDEVQTFVLDPKELPTPEQAEAAQAEVFATRYSQDN